MTALASLLVTTSPQAIALPGSQPAPATPGGFALPADFLDLATMPVLRQDHAAIGVTLPVAAPGEAVGDAMGDAALDWLMPAPMVMPAQATVAPPPSLVPATSVAASAPRLATDAPQDEPAALDDLGEGDDSGSGGLSPDADPIAALIAVLSIEPTVPPAAVVPAVVGTDAAPASANVVVEPGIAPVAGAAAAMPVRAASPAPGMVTDLGQQPAAIMRASAPGVSPAPLPGSEPPAALDRLGKTAALPDAGLQASAMDRPTVTRESAAPVSTAPADTGALPQAPVTTKAETSVVGQPAPNAARTSLPDAGLPAEVGEAPVLAAAPAPMPWRGNVTASTPTVAQPAGLAPAVSQERPVPGSAALSTPAPVTQGLVAPAAISGGAALQPVSLPMAALPGAAVAAAPTLEPMSPRQVTVPADAATRLRFVPATGAALPAAANPVAAPLPASAVTPAPAMVVAAPSLVAANRGTAAAVRPAPVRAQAGAIGTILTSDAPDLQPGAPVAPAAPAPVLAIAPAAGVTVATSAPASQPIMADAPLPAAAPDVEQVVTRPPLTRTAAPAAPAPVLPAAVFKSAGRVFADAIHRAVSAIDPAPSLPCDATALMAAGPITAAPATAVASPTAPIDMTRELWPQAMVSRIEQLRDMMDAADTRIRLIPDALGAIDVSLRRDGDTVQVQLVAEQPQTRALIAEAQPRLAELAEARGVKLQQAGTDAQATGGQLGHGQFGAGQGQRQPQPQPQTPQPAAPPRTRTAAGTDAETEQRVA